MNVKVPTTNPMEYKTLAGLVNAARRAMQAKSLGQRRTSAMTLARWIENAKFAAELNFGDTTSIQKLQAELCITRSQDLNGGHSLFGIALPTRPYQIGDNIPAIGKIQDIHQISNGIQYKIDGEWLHERCLPHVTHK
jgi:hypothetical protein